MTKPLTAEQIAKVLVLIPTVNESTLEIVVKAVCEQMRGVEVALLGFGNAVDIAEKYDLTFFDFQIKTPKAIVINHAILNTKKEWIIILDADAIPDINWAENMLLQFERGTEIFSGAVDIDKGNFWMKVYNFSMLHEFSREKVPSCRKHLPAISLGFTRSFFEKNGPFREDIIRSQDYEWTLRASEKGTALIFVPSAVVIHIPINKDSLRSVLKYWYYSGYDNWKIRNMYSDFLRTPAVLRSRFLILLFAPVLAIIPTLRILKTSPRIVLKNICLFPWVYITKIIWCFGVYFHKEKK